MDNSKVCPHDSCVLSSFRGLKNGIYYGAKVRFTHALVMTILFRKGTIREKFISICDLTIEHAKNLGLYVFFYKAIVCILNNLRKKNDIKHHAVAGFISAYYAFRKKTPVNMQIFLYLFSRVIIGSLEYLMKNDKIPTVKYGRIGISLCFGVAMLLFEDDPESMQISWAKSMKFLYRDSDSLVSSWKDLIPFIFPFSLNTFFPK